MTYRFKVLSDVELEALPDESPCFEPSEFLNGDCDACGDEEVLLIRSDSMPLHYVCKECHFRGL